jgi:hypothetical protein
VMAIAIFNFVFMVRLPLWLRANCQTNRSNE